MIQNNQQISNQIDKLDKRISKLTNSIQETINNAYWGWKQPYKGELDARIKIIDGLINKMYWLTLDLEDVEKQSEIIIKTEKARKQRDKNIEEYTDFTHSSFLL